MLCKHEVVGSIPMGSTNLRGEAEKVALRSLGVGGLEKRRAASVGSRQVSRSAPRTPSTETISFGARNCASRKIIDIVKAGLAGSHNRLIHTTLKTDRKNAILRQGRPFRWLCFWAWNEC